MSKEQTIDLSKVVISDEALSRVSAKFAQRFGVLPVLLDGETLTVVQTDPDDPLGPMQLEGQTGLRIITVKAKRPDSVGRAIERYYSGQTADSVLTGRDVLEHLINRAIQIHCSDIHLDPEEKVGLVRMRVDGMMRVISEYPLDFMNNLISAVKVAAKLDIAENREPQDGQMRLESLGESVVMRVAVIPTVYGEKMTLRILATAAVSEELDRLDALGMNKVHYNTFF